MQPACMQAVARRGWCYVPRDPQKASTWAGPGSGVAAGGVRGTGGRRGGQGARWWPLERVAPAAADAQEGGGLLPAGRDCAWQGVHRAAGVAAPGAGVAEGPDVAVAGRGAVLGAGGVGRGGAKVEGRGLRCVSALGWAASLGCGRAVARNLSGCSLDPLASQPTGAHWKRDTHVLARSTVHAHQHQPHLLPECREVRRAAGHRREEQNLVREQVRVDVRILRG